MSFAKIIDLTIKEKIITIQVYYIFKYINLLIESFIVIKIDSYYGE